jgi:hypothetical protein
MHPALFRFRLPFRALLAAVPLADWSCFWKKLAVVGYQVVLLKPTWSEGSRE